MLKQHAHTKHALEGSRSKRRSNLNFVYADRFQRFLNNLYKQSYSSPAISCKSNFTTGRWRRRDKSHVRWMTQSFLKRENFTDMLM